MIYGSLLHTLRGFGGSGHRSHPPPKEGDISVGCWLSRADLGLTFRAVGVLVGVIGVFPKIRGPYL